MVFCLLVLLCFGLLKNHTSSEMRNAVRDTHFFMDRNSKLLGFRGWYHKIHGVFLKFMKLGWEYPSEENVYDV